MQTTLDVLELLEKEDDKQRSNNLKGKLNRSISRDIGEFLSVLVRGLGSTKILELGTSVGYSTVWLALVAQSNSGHVHTFEKDTELIEKAKMNIEKAGLSKFVTFHNESIESAEIPESDFVFLDTETRDFVSHLNRFFPKLIPGGTIVAHGTLVNFEEARDYIEKVRDNPKTNSVLIPLGRGMELTYKFKNDEPEIFTNSTMVR